MLAGSVAESLISIDELWVKATGSVAVNSVVALVRLQPVSDHSAQDMRQERWL